MYTFNIDPQKNNNQFEKYNYVVVTLRGVFLALLIFCASFLAPYLGCNYQSLLQDKKYTRYILLFLVIYFSINLVDPTLGNKENPFIAVIKSIFVFGLFIILNQIDITSIVLVLILFALLIFTSRYYTYFKETTVNIGERKFTNDLLLVIQYVLTLSIFGVLFLSIAMNFDSRTFFSLDQCKIYLTPTIK